jgi:hypothetical protein
MMGFFKNDSGTEKMKIKSENGTADLTCVFHEARFARHEIRSENGGPFPFSSAETVLVGPNLPTQNVSIASVAYAPDSQTDSMH